MVWATTTGFVVSDEGKNVPHYVEVKKFKRPEEAVNLLPTAQLEAKSKENDRWITQLPNDSKTPSTENKAEDYEEISLGKRRAN